MSDNKKGMHVSVIALRTLYPIEPPGNLRRHLNTLAALISGIVGSKSVNLPAVARSTPGCKGQQWSKPESRVKCFYRWLKNGTIQPETYFIPFAQILVQSLSHGRLYLVIDGSTVGWSSLQKTDLAHCLDGGQKAQGAFFGSLPS